MDTHDPLSIKADLLHIGSVANRALNLIALVNNQAKALFTKEGINEENMETFELGRRVLRDLQDHWHAVHGAGVGAEDEPTASS